MNVSLKKKSIQMRNRKDGSAGKTLAVIPKGLGLVPSIHSLVISSLSYSLPVFGFNVNMPHASRSSSVIIIF